MSADVATDRAAGTLLWTLRDRGYSVTLRDGRLRIWRATPPPNEGSAVARLQAAQPALERLLEVEQHPAVLAVLTEFPDARLVRVEEASPDRVLTGLRRDDGKGGNPAGRETAPAEAAGNPVTPQREIGHLRDRGVQ